MGLKHQIQRMRWARQEQRCSESGANRLDVLMMKLPLFPVWLFGISGCNEKKCVKGENEVILAVATGSLARLLSGCATQIWPPASDVIVSGMLQLLWVCRCLADFSGSCRLILRVAPVDNH